MMTVRFPTGVSITYNDAHFVRHGDGEYKLYTANPDTHGGKIVALIQSSAGAVVELAPACRVEDPVHGGSEDALNGVLARLKDLGDRYPHLVARLKRELRPFNATTRGWR